LLQFGLVKAGEQPKALLLTRTSDVEIVRRIVVSKGKQNCFEILRFLILEILKIFENSNKIKSLNKYIGPSCVETKVQSDSSNIPNSARFAEAPLHSYLNNKIKNFYLI